MEPKISGIMQMNTPYTYPFHVAIKIFQSSWECSSARKWLRWEGSQWQKLVRQKGLSACRKHGLKSINENNNNNIQKYFEITCLRSLEDYISKYNSIMNNGLGEEYTLKYRVLCNRKHHMNSIKFKIAKHPPWTPAWTLHCGKELSTNLERVT